MISTSPVLRAGAAAGSVISRPVAQPPIRAMSLRRGFSLSSANCSIARLGLFRVTTYPRSWNSVLWKPVHVPSRVQFEWHRLMRVVGAAFHPSKRLRVPPDARGQEQYL